VPGLLARLLKLMVRRDPSEPRLTAEPLPQDAPQAKQRNTLPLDRVTTVLTGDINDSSAPDFAVHLPLQQIVEQACLATKATASALALRQRKGDEIVCLATVGANAPDLGMSLNTSSGLSGACVRTRQVQYCDDTETDERVDAAACRNLKVRSVLVVPLLHGDELLGVFEIFSPLPHAFGHQDLQTLYGLARWIEENLRGAAEGAAPSATLPEYAEPVVNTPAAPPQDEVQPYPWATLDPSYQAEAAPPPPRRTTASSLTAALLHAQPWPARSEPSPQPSSDTAPPRLAAASTWGVSSELVDPPPLEPQQRDEPSSEPAALPSVASASWGEESSTLAETRPPAPAEIPAPEPPIFSAVAKPPGRDWASGFLTVIVIALALLLGWMLGRVGWQGVRSSPKTQAQLSPAATVSRAGNTSAGPPPADSAAPDIPPSEPSSRSPFQPRSPTASKGQADTEAASNGDLVIYQDGRIIFRQSAQMRNAPSETDPVDAKSSGSAASASPRLIHRVEPVYPAEARRLHVQGSVVLDAMVDRNGEVHELRLISGNTQLATAAAEAVRQWRFAPYRKRGKIVDFKTRLTLKFTLP
jgi:TonB family protein